MSRGARAPRWQDGPPLRTFTGEALPVLLRSRKFDLVYKLRLARAWARGDRADVVRAETDYLEMQRARLSFFEDDPLRTRPGDFIDAFRRTAAAIRSRGYDFSAPPIPLEEGTLELLNGAHRLASCAAFGRPCPFAVYPRVYFGSHGGSTFRAFRAGNIDAGVENRGVRAYLELNANARLVGADLRSGEDEEDAIARVERDTGGVVWHARRRPGGLLLVVAFPDGVPDGVPSRDETRSRAEAEFPDLPYPDWRARERAFSPGGFPVWLRQLRYRLTLPLRSGRRRRKAELHILDLACRRTAYARLADYLESSVPSKGLET